MILRQGWAFKNTSIVLSESQHTHPLVDVHELWCIGLQDRACVRNLAVANVRCRTYPWRLVHDRALICQFLFFNALKTRVFVPDFVGRGPPSGLYYLLL
jgi:hypothetical protein